MAKKYKAPSPADEKFDANVRRNKEDIEVAATVYTYRGMKGLGLNPNQEDKLAKKIIPIVKMQMTSDRGRAASRAKAQVRKEKMSDKKAAIKKSFGGNK